MMTADCVKTYTIPVNDDGSLPGEYDNPEDIGIQLDDVVQAHARKHRLTYTQAFHEIIDDPAHADLVLAYCAVP